MYKVPHEIDQALIKIAKRGSKTRSKGFVELIEGLKSIDTCNLPQLALLLRSSFVSIFKKYIFSPEKSVRLCIAQMGLILIPAADPKNFLQPILKEILFQWMLSLFDPISEIASIQRKCFETMISSSAKMEILLDKFGGSLWMELKEYSDSNKKFENLKEIILKDMEGTSEEVAAAVELVKTEIVGLVTLLMGRFENDLLETILFLKDSSIGTMRRMAIYRFIDHCRRKFPQILRNQTCLNIQTITNVMGNEVSAVGTSAALDLLKNSYTDQVLRESFYDLLKEDLPNLNLINNLPIEDLSKYTEIVRLYQVDKCELFLKVCNTNVVINKERFLAFWKCVIVPIFRGDLSFLMNILFTNSRSSIKTFFMLTAEETFSCLLEAYSLEEISQVCSIEMESTDLVTSNTSQLTYLLAKCERFNELEEVISKLSVLELQKKELVKSIPSDIMIKRLNSLGSFDSKTLIKMIKTMPEAIVIDTLNNQTNSINFSVYDLLEVVNNISKEKIKNVLFKISKFREQMKNLEDSKVLIESALECNDEIFDEIHNLENEITLEALYCVTVTKTICLTSPLLISLIKSKSKQFLSDINSILIEQKPVNLDELYSVLNLNEDAELFVLLRCENERFFPVEYVKGAVVRANIPILNELECVLFKSNLQKRNDNILQELLKFPAKCLENQILIAKCSLIYNSNFKYNFEVSMSDLEGLTDPLEIIALSRGVCVTPDSCALVNDFKRAVIFNLVLRYHFSKEIFSYFDQILFPLSGVIDENVSKYVSMAISLDNNNSFQIRGDHLSVLIDSVKDETVLLLMCSVFLDRSEVNIEFWRVKWVERLKDVITKSTIADPLKFELSCRVAAGLWKVLERPEQDLLSILKVESLFNVSQLNFENEMLYFEPFGSATLFALNASSVSETLEFYKRVFVQSQHLSWLLAARNVITNLFLDKSIVTSQVQSKDFGDSDSDSVGQIIFPFYDLFIEMSLSLSSSCRKDKDSVKFLLLIEMFLSWFEGSRDDSILRAAFHDVFKNVLYSKIKNTISEIDHVTECFNFHPRHFEYESLSGHVLFRIAADFPLIVSPDINYKEAVVQILQKREIDRIRRNPKISNLESIEIILKPIITSTTRCINLNVNFAGEINLEIVLHLPENFPLETVRVEGLKRSGLAESKWKASLMSLQSLLRSTSFSGNLVEVVKKWQSNALKLFEGLEECAVCYCVLHPSDKSLPGPSCKQCKHKFHASCLYKWFKSSGNSTCPLCRALY